MKNNKTPKTILIAEDEAINRMYLAEILKDKKYRILEAEDGDQAVELCRNHPEIDLVLMDVKMPGLNGYRAAEQIRTFRPDLIMILQTAFISDKSELEGPEDLFQDVIEKPIKENRLFEMLNSYLMS
ncbi:response regulator [Fidelibacter multiformis]|uniref:response regulator n=1 Tax=Fidelibacter multiformis TaxID=3377529 RepID=UPI0037DDA14A